MNVLVTGGAGYIGSHACLELLQAGHEVIVVDNLVNSKRESLDRVQEITGKTLGFHEVDILDKTSLTSIFGQYSIDVVIHFAGFKAVGESVQLPLVYYRNNVMGTITLCEVMQQHHVHSMIFSSSCTVYGDPKTIPVKEDSPQIPTNPYGRSKLVVEDILNDLYKANKEWDIICLRYFNPIGAHPSKRIGEDPTGIPNNLLPYISQVAVGKLNELSVFGNEYPTDDGTAIRDYIHVVDLAIGHVKALEFLETNPGFAAYNLGTGKGCSVLEMIETFEMASGKKIPYKITKPRPGDAAITYADPSLAQEKLNWSAKLNLVDMCTDTWGWQEANPDGYD